ncbi:DUF397 domain-containing protein [Nocardiopsis endophytica]
MFGSEDHARPVSEAPNWHKASYSNAGGNCVEVAESAGGAAVRDSKSPDLGHLSFAGHDWAALLTLLKADTLP